MFFNTHVDLDAFEEVPAPQSHQGICRLSISAGDRMSQNEAFLRETRDTPAFRLKVSGDGRQIFLGREGPLNLTFTDKGVRTHHPLGMMLRQQGIELPAAYLFVWREDLGGWLGFYGGLSEPPAKPPRPSGRRVRKAG